MTTAYLTITPRDPIIARDGRPFGAGQGDRMRTLDWPYPSVLAGSLRTMLGKEMGGNFNDGIVNALKRIDIAGPFPLMNEQLYFPAPGDILVREEDKRRECFVVRPRELKTGEGCDLHALHPRLLPAMILDTVEDFKPAKAPAFWSMEKMVEWLCNPAGKSFEAPPTESKDTKEFLDAPTKDDRMHVKIDSSSGAAEEGELFMTVGLAIPQQVQLAARLEIEDNNDFSRLVVDMNALHPFGGERRLAHWRSCATNGAWEYPDKLDASFSGRERIRLVLATPAIFTKGWLPEWIDEKTLEGAPPGAPTGTRLRLVSACVDRWKPISGWSLEKGKSGPKPVRRLVPTGSVYFFDIIGGSAKELAKVLWIKPVSDEEQDRRDGFGLALWGTWESET